MKQIHQNVQNGLSPVNFGAFYIKKPNMIFKNSVQSQKEDKVTAQCSTVRCGHDTLPATKTHFRGILISHRFI